MAVLAFLLAAQLLTATGVLGAPAAEAGTCAYPGQVLDLSDWKLQLPVSGADDPDGILEIQQPELATYSKAPYFVSRPGNCGAGVTFRAPLDGVHTPGSSFPRAELREMNADGSPAAWSSTSGTHTLTETIAFVAQPNEKPDVVGAQIHNAAEDITLLLLRGSNLYLSDGENATAKLVTGDYRLGTKLHLKYVVSGGQIKEYVDGVLQLTINRVFGGAFFKAGAYPQANCDDSSPCNATNYGSTIITELSVSHT